MREIKITMWDLDENCEQNHHIVSTIFWLSETSIDRYGIDWFKEAVRQEFEKLIEKWEKENAE